MTNKPKLKINPRSRVLNNNLYICSMIKIKPKFILNRYDLESVGFIYIEKKEQGKYIFINKSENNKDEKIYFGNMDQNKRYIVIKNNCGQVYFMGWLKNKKELKKILKQLLIKYNKSSS